MAQAGHCSTRRARTAERPRREAAPRARVTGTASTGRHRTHAVPGPAFPHRSAGGGRAFASRHRRGRRNRSRFRHPFGEPRPVGSSPDVRAHGARSATTHAGPPPPTAESDTTHAPRGTATTGPASSPKDGGYRSRVRVPVGRWGGTGARWRRTVHGLDHPCQCTCYTGHQGVTGGAARARRFDRPHVGPTRPDHAFRWCECQRHTGYMGHTRGRCAARASGVRTRAATHRDRRQGKADHIADANNPSTVTSAWTWRRVATTRWGWVALHAARQRHVQATANGNPGPHRRTASASRWAFRTARRRAPPPGSGATLPGTATANPNGGRSSGRQGRVRTLKATPNGEHRGKEAVPGARGRDGHRDSSAHRWSKDVRGEQERGGTAKEEKR